VRNPQVTVNLKEAVSRVVTVEGQVNKPGLYPVVGRLSLMGAIAKAEGTDEFSKLDDVVVFRTVGGHRYAALYNLDAIRHGAYPDPEIYANDVVMVGESKARRLFKDILSVMPAMITPIVIGVDRLTD
jgi:polysaccharide export outer membrane protein